MRDLVEKLANAEQKFIGTRFLAPRIQGSRVMVKVEGLVTTFTLPTSNFEGWGVFEAGPDFRARLLAPAARSQTESYLHLLRPVRLFLLRPLQGRSWLAYPVQREIAERRAGIKGPTVVHLVERGRAFEQIVARWDGSALWYEKNDRTGDPRTPARMAAALRAFVSWRALRFSGLTPELREAYRIVLKQEGELRVRCSETRLRRALEMGGGRLESYLDGGDFWTTHWVSGDGRRHTSAIRKDDLTVISAGICLSGEDAKFDLQSLVGVVERAD